MRRPRTRTLLLFGLLIVGGAGFLAWSNVNSVLENHRGVKNLPELLRRTVAERYEKSTSHRIRSERDNMKKEAREMKERLLAEFPALKVEKHPVPDDQNGFLMLIELGDFIDKLDPPLSEEFRQLLSGTAPWDAEAAKRFLAEHEKLVSRIEQIAALETRSSEDLASSYDGFVNARAGKTASEILLLKARLAAEAGDENEALRLLTATSNMGAHYTEIESPSLLTYTVAILIDLSIKNTAFKTLLPAVGQSADLSRWESLFESTRYTSSNMVQMLRGEWNTGAEHLLLPHLITAEKNGELPDAEAVAHAYASFLSTWVSTLPSLNLNQTESYRAPLETSHLSKEGQDLIDVMTVGADAWLNGYRRAAVVSSQRQAALELLILEKNGATLTPEDAARVTHDPLSGLPYVFDPVKRELLTPEESRKLEVEPLILPP